MTAFNRNWGNGQLDEVSVTNPNNPSGSLTTSYGYDSSGRVTSVVHPIGSQSWDYDDELFGQLEHYYDDVHDTYYDDIDPLNGNVRSMRQWDGNDWLETTYTYTDELDNTLLGLVETITDPNGNITLYTYNCQGLVEGIAYAVEINDEIVVQHEVHYEYDDRDRLSAMIDGRGARTKYVYDNLDRLISRVDPDPDTKLITSASPVWEYRYDKVGNQTHIIDPLGNVTEYVYDTRGRLFQQIAPTPNGAPSVTTKNDSQYNAVTGTWASSSLSGA